MKYILILITIVLIALIFYLNIGNDSNNHTEYLIPKKDLPVRKKISTHNIQKEKVKQTIKTPNHNETFIDEKGDTITIYHTSGRNGTIGQGITLESIQNSNLSEEEKELLLADMIYYQSMTQDKTIQLSEEDALNLIEYDIEEGIIE